ncbi:hypothetical protein PHYBOEH_008697 [Phytophthora boehmeriae]|uniref:PexRD2 WYL domain-containing protein n=1 Tax=Phytophthora boehmeriae TaxID=109152 RepID=A0A8T1W2Y3_9STRA|nr:hypothetical protein PHYBOEH_008697 [Phytophthora boehmeriae]
MATDTKQVKISDVTPLGGPSQRLLRIRHMANEDNGETEEGDDDHGDGGDTDFSEERGLTPKKMKKMMKKGMTKDDYAHKLGISEKIAEIMLTGRGLAQFQQTHKYQKYKTYMNFLRENK